MSGLPAGRNVDGYQLLDLLGRGGMGVVYLARDPAGREVALKLLHGQLTGRKLERFRREGEATARLRHPGIVTVHAAGDVGGQPYLVYALVEGARTLDEASQGASLRERVARVRDAARALGYAHQRGVIHRDVKPENVLVDREGRVRLTDFGLARVEDGRALTQSGTMLGTPYSMAPEQLEGQGGPGVDVWALGLLLYRALTGRLPFDGSTPTELMAQIALASVTPPHELAGDVPPELEQVCLRALARRPQDRPADGEALARELDAWLAGTPHRPARGWLALAALLLVLGSGGGAAWLSRGTPTPLEPSATRSSPPALEPTPDAASTPYLPPEGRLIEHGEVRVQATLLAGERALTAGYGDGGDATIRLWDLSVWPPAEVRHWRVGTQLALFAPPLPGRHEFLVGSDDPHTPLVGLDPRRDELRPVALPGRVAGWLGVANVAQGAREGERWFAVCGGVDVVMWPEQAPEQAQGYRVDSEVGRLAAAPDGSFLAFVMGHEMPGVDGLLICLRAPGGEPLGQPSSLPLHPNCLAISPDGARVAVGMRSGGLSLLEPGGERLLDLTGREFADSPFKPAHEGDVTWVGFGQDGQLYSTSYMKHPGASGEREHVFKCWDPDMGEERWRRTLAVGPVNASLGVDRALVGGRDGTACYLPLAQEGSSNSPR